jgi:hypothetical protein
VEPITVTAAVKGLTDPGTVIAALAALAAWAAAVVAYLSARAARQANKLSLQQEARKVPRIILYLATGFERATRTHRCYAISLSLSNPTDTDNAVARLELQILYRLPSGVIMTLRLPHCADVQKVFRRPTLKAISVPLPVAAHGTVAGWGFFELSLATIAENCIEEYKILVGDTHSVTSEIEVGSLRALRDEAR